MPIPRAAAACSSTWAFTTSIWPAGSWATFARSRRSARRSPIRSWRRVGDIDNAIASLTFTSGKLGVVDLTRSGIYGYDISTEILGLEGTIRIGYLRETPILVMTKANGVSHDTVPYFMERFRDAYTKQLQNFAQNVLQQREPPITIDDGLEALRIGVAATRARESGTTVTVAGV